MQPPLVSVIAICYNHARFLLEGLNSIRHQSYQPIQLIIMDDCSSDRSVALIRDWITTHNITCQFIAHSKNQGLCATLNEALQYARGDYVAILSLDDVWLPRKLEKQVAILEENPAVGVVYSDAYRIDENSHPVEPTFLKHVVPHEVSASGDLFVRLLSGNFIPYVSTLIRSQCYKKVGVYDPTLCYEDWDMWIRIAEHFPFIYSHEIDVKYREVQQSLNRLLATERVHERLTSDFLTLQKFRQSPRVQEMSVRDGLHHRLHEVARQMRSKRHPQARHFLKQALHERFSCSLLLTYLFALCHIPYAIESKLQRGMRCKNPS